MNWKLFSLMVAACLMLSPSAIAQYGSSGSSYSGLGSSGSSAKVAGYGSSGSTVSYAAVSSVVTYGSSGSSAAGYGSNGSAATAYGSSGSAAKVAKDFRPLRSILENKPVRSRLSAVSSLVVAAPAAVAKTVVAAGSKYQVALASAQARAASGRKGHMMSIESGYTTGVGYSSFNSAPNTCLGRGGPNYAVVRGSDGWYATKVQ